MGAGSRRALRGPLPSSRPVVRITVSFDHALDRYGDRLQAFAKQLPRLAADSLNEAGDLERTQVRRSLRHQTGVKAYGSITKRTSSHRASPGHLQYDILGAGKGMPITEFPVKAGAHKPVTAQPWGVSHTFARSFQTSAQGLYRARLGPKRFPIQSLNGPSVAKEIVKGETAAGFEATAAVTLDRILIKRLGRLLP